MNVNPNNLVLTGLAQAPSLLAAHLAPASIPSAASTSADRFEPSRLRPDESAQPSTSPVACPASQSTSAPGALVLSSKPTQIKQFADADQYDCDVVVVGAGMAGLTAAKNLLAQGYRVQILEADDHKGGRANTNKSDFCIPVDMGCAWLHDVNNNPLTPLVDALGIKHERTDYFRTMFVNGKPATPAEQAEFDSELQQFESQVQASANRGEDVSASTFLPEGRFSKTIGFELGDMDTALPIDKSSSVEVARFAMGTDDLVWGGLGGFVEKYGADVPVTLNTRVSKVSHDGSGVTVETSQGSKIRARHVVMTTSTGVLNKGAIAFEPALPKETQQAIQGLPMGDLEKIVLEFKPGSLAEVPANTWVVNHEDNPQGTRMDFLLRPLGQPLAVAFVGGEAGPAFISQPTQTCVDKALHTLETLYGPQLDEAFVCGGKTNWANNELTQGAYSAALPGEAGERALLRAPVDGRVHFAGEDTARVELNGSLPGAYEEGLRVAHEIDASLSQQAQPAKA